jgi:hypothetical protein
LKEGRKEEDRERVISICWKKARQGVEELNGWNLKKKQPHNTSDKRREF